MQLENHWIVLPRAASGIGLALLERLAASPAQVVAVDVPATSGLKREVRFTLMV